MTGTSTGKRRRAASGPARTSASATGALDIAFSGNKLATTTTALGGGVMINPANGGQVTANVRGNDIEGAVGSAIAYELDAPSAGLLKGTISGNTIGQPDVPGSGSLQGEGISVTGNGNGTVTVAVLDIAIRQWSSGSGIGIVQGSGDGTTNATVRGNAISNPGMLAGNGIRAEAGAIAGDGGTLCADIGGTGDAANSATGSGASLGTDLRVRHRFETTVQLPGYVGSPTDTAAVSGYLSARNGGATASADVNTTDPFGGQFRNPGASCPAP